QAAIGLLGPEIEISSHEHFEEVFRVTTAGEVDHCLIPIENSLSGSIHKNYDLLLQHNLKIAKETNLRVEHNLIVLPGVKFTEVETVASHPVALDQCGRFFEEHPQLTKASSYDTSGSVKQIMEQELKSTAAIAGEKAADHYGAEVLMAGIQDNQENFTRFFLLARDPEIWESCNKTSIVFSFKNTPGALFKCLGVFALRDIDLFKIESRPIAGRAWEYLFYMDFLGTPEVEACRNALNHLGELTEFLEVLGSYPRDATLEKKRI
ncbi:MAG: prephenate dehydratase domain-containing protein, partial [Alphaproteobacteria bacterium]|nr:prephenate dehydratase domain-containing protein [Alphaproteobacteria bacterium]